MLPSNVKITFSAYTRNLHDYDSAVVATHDAVSRQVTKAAAGRKSPVPYVEFYRYTRNGWKCC